jgi:hypothetical protein
MQILRGGRYWFKECCIGENPCHRGVGAGTLVATVDRGSLVLSRRQHRFKLCRRGDGET